jgi:hypothetical protein
VKVLMCLMLGRFAIEVTLKDVRPGKGFFPIKVQMPGQWVPWLVRPRKSYLQKEGLVLFVVLDPADGRIRRIDVAMQVFIKVPGDTLEFTLPLRIRTVAVVGPGFAMVVQVVAPVIITVATPVAHAGRVFDNNTIVKSTKHIPRLEMHFPDTGTMVTVIRQILDPCTVMSPVEKAVGSRIVGIHAGEHGCPGGHTGRPGTIGLAKGEPVPRKAVHVGCYHMPVPPSSDGIEALLIRHDENDIGPCVHSSRCFISPFGHRESMKNPGNFLDLGY